jgi:hypothetical protein
MEPEPDGLIVAQMAVKDGGHLHKAGEPWVIQEFHGTPLSYDAKALAHDDA